MTTQESRKKRKRVSKNKKKSWKITDVADVEDYLEDKRLQERTGGVRADKTDSELFIIEKQAPLKKEPVRQTRKQERKTRCYAHLEPDTFVKPIRVPHNFKNKLKQKSLEKVEKKLSKQKKPVKQQPVKRLRTRQTRLATYDLWGERDITELPANVDEHYSMVTQLKRVKPKAHYHKKPSGVSAVEVPHPGQSYNPSYDDHQELLSKALEAEEKKLKDEKRITRALDEMFPTADKAPTQESWLQEMSGGLADDDDDDATKRSFTQEELESISCNPPVRREDKKTEQQRRKLKERKLKEKKAAALKDDKMKKQELFRLRSIKRSVKEREQELEERRLRRAALREKCKDNPKKMGKLKYEEPDLELKLGGELKGSLRLLKPEGHLMKDRFKSFQKRNILEPRNRAKVVRKYKDKVFEKRGHKQVTL